MFERRKTHRAALDQVTVECYTYEKQTIPTCEGHILNLGLDGMMVEMDEPTEIRLDDEVFLSFVLPDGSRFTKKKSRVIWQARDSDATFGVYFPGQSVEDLNHLKTFLALQDPSKG